MKKLCLIACLLSALALAACGGAAGDEAAEVEDAIRASVIDPDPSACTELRTQRYLEQSAQKRGPAALADCEEELEHPVNRTESVTISDVEIEGDTATTQVAPVGGWLDGQVAEFSLAQEQGQWKLDLVTRFVEFDASAFARATEKTAAGRLDASPEQIECFGSELEKVTRPEAEVLALSPRVTEELLELGRRCLGSAPAPAGAGERVSPEGAAYSYLVPAGFALSEPQTRRQPATAVSAVSLIGGGGAGQGVVVGQIPGVPIRTRAQLLRALPAIDQEFEETVAQVGAAASPTKVLEIDGRQAVQRETEGRTMGPFPGTDYRETAIFAQPETVLVVCRWKGTGKEREAILEGCDSVLRSLRLSDGDPSSTSS